MADQNVNKYISYFEGSTPILLEMPHSGLTGLSLAQIPHCLSSKADVDEFTKIVGFGCDASVPEMTGIHGRLRSLNPYGIYNNLARVYCDTNRDKEDVSGWALEGKDPNSHHHGIIWIRERLGGLDLSLPVEELEKIVDQCKKTMKAPLTQEEFDNLMKEVYDPYHATVRRLQDQIVEDHGYCIHLAFHSMPPFSTRKIYGGYIFGQKATRGSFDMAKNTLPDVILIHNNFKAADKNVVDTVRWAFESEGLIVEDGQGPVLGDIGVTKKYGNPRMGFNIIGIEHVAHDTEPERHLGSPLVNTAKAMAFQASYEKVVKSLL